MRQLITFLFLMFSAPVAAPAQDDRYIEKQLAAFIPAGYNLLRTVKGDLNLDAYTDAILVLGPAGEDSLSSLETPLNRMVLLLTGVKDGGYIVAVRSEKLIYHYKYDLNFHEPLVDVRLEKGGFAIDHYGGFARRWGRTTSFSFDKDAGTWLLSSDEYSTFSSMNPDQDPTEVILTKEDFGRVPLEKFDIYEDRTEWADPARNIKKDD